MPSNAPAVLNDPRLEFDESAHRYRLAGRELISVTTAIKEAGMVDMTHWNEYARQRGSYLHQAIHLHVKGELEPGSIDPALEPYFVAFHTFLQDAAIDFEHCERRVCDPRYGYAGTLDAIVWWPDRQGQRKRVLIDWKSGFFPPMAAAQTAAYLRCAREWYPAGTFISRAGLWLRGDGSYRTQFFTDVVQDEADFLAALRVAQFRRRHGLGASE